MYVPAEQCTSMRSTEGSAVQSTSKEWMVTALASLYTKIPARSDTAMTGEVTLTGLVLPIGGVKEKILGARRAGIRRVILPKANAKDMPELPEDVRNDTEVIFASKVSEVLQAALTKPHAVPPPTSLDWN